MPEDAGQWGVLLFVVVGLAVWVLRSVNTLQVKIGRVEAIQDGSLAENARRFAELTSWIKSVDEKLDKLLMKGP